jgi:hypothetical protein
MITNYGCSTRRPIGERAQNDVDARRVGGQTRTLAPPKRCAATTSGRRYLAALNLLMASSSRCSAAP